MIAGIFKETFPNERRVAVIPSHVPPLTKAGLEVVVERGAGEGSSHADAEYEKQGARVEADRRQALSSADVLLMVRGPGAAPNFPMEELEACKPGAALIAFLEPLARPETARALAEKQLTVFAMELIPRVTRAQSMDALSSAANIAGYRAVLLAATALDKMFPMMMTAAGTITPSRVFVLGAGVAGLQAIATARRLGAIVEAYDVRPAVKEQVESLGARFVELDVESEEAEAAGGYAKAQSEEFYRRQQEALAERLRENDVIITTAQVPGKKAPVLITRTMAESLRPGTVIVDLAAEKGGNCELTEPNETVVHQGVKVIGAVNLPAEAAFHASQMYSKNITAFLLHLISEGELHIDTEDEITQGTLVARGGEIVHPQVKQALEGA